MTFLYGVITLMVWGAPFVVMYYHRWINHRLAQMGWSVKTPDLLTLGLCVAIFAFSKPVFGIAGFLWFIVAISSVAIGMVSYYVYTRQQFRYRSFFKVWWRLTCLIGLVCHISYGIAVLYHIITR